MPSRIRPARLAVLASLTLALATAAGWAQTPRNDMPKAGSPVIPNAMLGSWEQTIRDESGTEEDDASSTVEALLATHQDFHIYHIDSETDWQDFQELLAEADGTGLKLYAAMNSPSQSNSGSRWFDTDDDGGLGDTPPVNDCASKPSDKEIWLCQRDFMAEWLEAWERAARDLSLLSGSSYPGTLAGFVINDFMTYVESAALPVGVDGLRLTKEQIKRIYDASHQHPDSTVGFYPAVTFGSIGWFISPGFVLGTDYGVRMSDTDQMTVRFTVPLPQDAYAARLRFFHAASGEDLDLVRSVWVANDGRPPVEVWSEKLYDDMTPYPEVEYTEQWLDLDRGTNTVELRLYAQPTWGDGCGNLVTRGCGGIDFWHVWNVTLEYWVLSDDHPTRFVADLDPRYFTTADPDPYCVQSTCTGLWVDAYSMIQNDECRCHVDGPCTPFLPDSEIDGRLARRLVSSPNDAYLIQEVIDGIVPYVSDTDLYGPSDALDPGLYYQRLLRETKQDLGDDLLIAIHTAFPYPDDADTNVLIDRVYAAAAAADAAGVYRFPLSMYFMDAADRRGIFAERLTEVEGELLAQWPTDHAVLPGWYQRWVHQPPATTTTVDMVVTMWDNREPGPNDGNMSKWVDGGGLVEPYVGDPYADWADRMHPDLIPSDGTHLASSGSDPVVVGMSTVSGVPIYTWVYFSAVDASETVVTDWTFESGVNNPHTLEIYEALVEAYEIIGGP